MRIANEGRPFIAIAWGILLALLALGWWPAAVVWLPVAFWVIAFFRDPVRNGPRGEDLFICPADGKVISIIKLDEPTFLGGAAVRISIFMNVFNVHVNRYPVTGAIAHRSYLPGRFFNAAAEKASVDNEQSSIGIVTPNGKVLVRQIAGLVARRIITDASVGAEVVQGDRLGLIRFGSRVDLFVPADSRIEVVLGQQVLAGVTILGRWPDAA